MTRINLKVAGPSDVEAVADIYNYYVTDSVATFEETPVGVEDMAKRMKSIADQGHKWWVAEDSDQRIMGYAYATQWRSRSAYRFTVELSVYCAEGFRKRGVGRALYEKTLEALPARNIHSAIGVVTLPNDGSQALHQALGFSQVAELKQVGFKFGKWWDVGYWQKLL